MQIATHYNIVFREDLLKDELKGLVMLTLFERGVLAKESGGAGAEPLVVSSQSPVKHEVILSFEQQERLLHLQLELEQTKLRVCREANDWRSVHSRESMAVSANLRLMPQFSDGDPDTFITLFEHVAASRRWSDADKILLLPCMLTGKAQMAYFSVCGQENLTYEIVKTTVLKAYQLTGEAYRQKFRQSVKAERLTHVELVDELTSQFRRWCLAENVSTFDQLSQLIFLEQFKNALPARVVTYLNEREPNCFWSSSVG